MKKNILYAITLLVVLFFFGCQLNETTPSVTPTIDQLLTDDVKFDDEIIENYMAQFKDPSKAPAPPLSLLEILQVRSNDGGYENVDFGQILTDNDHGGPQMYILTGELGYGFSRYARMDGTLLSSVDSQAIVSGTTVIGWYYLWDACGSQGGQFTYENTSTNSPWNTMSDWINIR